MAILVEPDQTAPCGNLGPGLNDQRKYHPAAIYLEKALKPDPDDFSANTIWGVTYLKSGLYARAIQYFQRDSKVYKNNPNTYNYPGISFV